MRPSFEDMQKGELAWWQAFLSQPGAILRLCAIYGYRYLPFFFEEFGQLGRVVDFGSGPVSAAFIAEPTPALVLCVDPLFQEYRKAGLVHGERMIEYPLTFKARPADTALLLNVLDHCDDPMALLVQAVESLRPDGRLLVWNHVDTSADSLHRAIGAGAIGGWFDCIGGVKVERERLHQDYGPMAYMAVVRRLP